MTEIDQNEPAGLPREQAVRALLAEVNAHSGKQATLIAMLCRSYLDSATLLTAAQERDALAEEVERLRKRVETYSLCMNLGGVDKLRERAESAEAKHAALVARDLHRQVLLNHAVFALAHAAELNPIYKKAYEKVDAGIGFLADTERQGVGDA